MAWMVSQYREGQARSNYRDRIRRPETEHKLAGSEFRIQTAILVRY